MTSAPPYSSGMAQADQDWREIAAEFALAPGLTYLNCGSEGSLPRRMQEQLAASMARWASSPSESFFDNPDLDRTQLRNRACLAAFVEADPADVVLTDNTTMGLAMALLGLPFRAGDEILTTSQDHFSMASPLFVLASRSGVKVVELNLPVPAHDPDEIVEIFRSAINSNTRAFCFSHINYGLGLRMPVRALCEMARQHAILTVVDGAHALGMLDLNMEQLGADFYAASGHKWLNGPPGTGIFYVRAARDNPWQLAPIISERAMSIDADLTITDALQARANLNGPAFHVLARTAAFAQQIGKARIEARILALGALVEELALAHWGPACLLSASHRGQADVLRSGLTAFVPSRDPGLAHDAARIQQIADTLVKKYGIWVLATTAPDPAGAPGAQLNALRVSTHIFNFPDQIHSLFARLQDIA